MPSGAAERLRLRSGGVALRFGLARRCCATYVALARGAALARVPPAAGADARTARGAQSPHQAGSAEAAREEPAEEGTGQARQQALSAGA